MSSEEDYPSPSVIGKSIPRVDALDKVLGRAQFTADLQRNFPGLLHTKVLRSPHAHARIAKLDTFPGGKTARRAGGGHRKGLSGKVSLPRPAHPGTGRSDLGRGRGCRRRGRIAGDCGGGHPFDSGGIRKASSRPRRGRGNATESAG